MAHYIDGFVLPISRDRLDEYKRLVEAIAEIWKEHGALDYREYVGCRSQRIGRGVGRRRPIGDSSIRRITGTR